MTAGKTLTMADIMAFVKSVDKKTWMRAAAITAGVLVLWFFVIWPAWFERPALRREIQTMTNQIRQVTALNQKRPTLEKNLKDYNDVITSAKGRLFTTEEIGLLLGQISKMADESKVEVISSKPQNEKITYAPPYNAKYSARACDFSLLGGYHELGKFISRLESYGKLLRIQSLYIRPSDKNPEQHAADLRVLAITVAPPLPPVKVTNAKK